MHVSDCLGISQGELLGKILDELELTDIHLVGPDVGMALLPLRTILPLALLNQVSPDLGDQSDKDADAHEDIEHGEDLPRRSHWREVAISDGGQRDDREVDAVDPVQVFDESVKDSSDRHDH